MTKRMLRRAPRMSKSSMLVSLDALGTETRGWQELPGGGREDFGSIPKYVVPVDPEQFDLEH